MWTAQIGSGKEKPRRTRPAGRGKTGGPGLRLPSRCIGKQHLPCLVRRQRTGQLRDCIAYGPGILDLAHQPDEFVGIDDLVQSAQVMALAVLDLQGVLPQLSR